MRKGLSTYLDLLRLLAALGVFLFHTKTFIAPGLSAKLANYGDECVAIFFLLSGFVIRYVTVEKERTWRSYASARAARIYSVAVLAIVVTLIADAIGHRFSLSPYAALPGFNPATSPADIAAYLSFTNEIWWRHVVVGSNEAYWSLGFEVLYYLFFGLISYARGAWRWVLAALWLAFAGPKVALYLPLWMLGVGLYEILRRPWRRFRFEWAVAGSVWLLTIPAFVAAHFRLRPPTSQAIFYVMDARLTLETAAYYTFVGVIAAVNIAAFDRMISDGLWPRWVAAGAKWLAGGTFTLYLCHEPVLLALAAAVPAARTDIGLQVAVCFAAIAALYGLAELGERRKNLFKKLANSVFR